MQGVLSQQILNNILNPTGIIKTPNRNLELLRHVTGQGTLYVTVPIHAHVLFMGK